MILTSYVATAPRGRTRAFGSSCALLMFLSRGIFLYARPHQYFPKQGGVVLRYYNGYRCSPCQVCTSGGNDHRDPLETTVVKSFVFGNSSALQNIAEFCAMGMTEKIAVRDIFIVVFLCHAHRFCVGLPALSRVLHPSIGRSPLLHSAYHAGLLCQSLLGGIGHVLFLVAQDHVSRVLPLLCAKVLPFVCFKSATPPAITKPPR